MSDNGKLFTVSDGVLIACAATGDVVIPNGINKIGEAAFCENGDITSVDLNEVTEIDDKAFYMCRNLKTAVGKKVKSVGDDCFRFCNVLERVTFGAVERIGNYAFFGCMNCVEISGTQNLIDIGESAFGSTDIAEMDISPVAVRLGAGAFSCCSYLKRFTVPQTIKTLEPCVFAGCEALKSIDLPEELERIEHGALFGCGRLRYIEIPPAVVFIAATAFERCRIADIYNRSKLDIKIGKNKNGRIAECAVHVYSDTDGRPTREAIDGYVFCVDERSNTPYLLEYNGEGKELVLPRDFHGKEYVIYRTAFAESEITCADIGDGVTAIENLAFYNCERLKDIKLGKGLKIIDRLAFKLCKSIEHVELGDGVEVIGVGAFLGTGIKDIVFGGSVREIKRSAFDYCDGFNAVYYKGTPEEFDKISIAGKLGGRLKSIARYYSETEPVSRDRKYWHYADGEIVEWQ